MKAKDLEDQKGKGILCGKNNTNLQRLLRIKEVMRKKKIELK